MSAARRVLVTGASTGIGHATATHLRARGWDVLAGVRKQQDGESLAAQGIEVVLLDVTDEASIAAAAKQVGDRPLHGLVNNAGVAIGGPLEYLPVERLRYLLEVNVVGVVAVTQALLPALRRATGRVVNIGSVGGRVSSPFVGPYNASKHAIEAITDSWRQELARWGLHVVVVEPGSVSTPIWSKGVEQVKEQRGSLPPDALERYGKELAAFDGIMERMDRMGVEPLKVARVVEKALTSRRPRPRYLVGVDAHAQVGLKTVLPTRVLDASVRKLLRL
jgi:NAD(P)-dependent dehydrogenase (short-subunit alcohol dehydrogenase family)